MNTTIRVVDEDHCAVCRQPARCVIVTIADEAGDMRRSALTLRTMEAAVCRSCIDRAFVQREPGKRHRWDGTPRADVPSWYSEERADGGDL